MTLIKRYVVRESKNHGMCMAVHKLLKNIWCFHNKFKTPFYRYCLTAWSIFVTTATNGLKKLVS